MADYTILAVEDDEGVRGLIRLTLGMEGYQVIEAEDGLAAEEKMKQGGFDLVLLDIMLPGKDGYSLLPELLKMDIPVIFLTARSGLSDKVLGLKSGVEDYITKPFEPLELLARVQLVLKRQESIKEARTVMKGVASGGAAGLQTTESQNGSSQMSAQKTTISYKDLVINVTAHTVLRNGEPAALTEKEYELLHFLVSHQGQALSREQILDAVWGYDYYGGTRTVDVHVSSLRSKLGLGKSLETVFKLGYRLKSEG